MKIATLISAFALSACTAPAVLGEVPVDAADRSLVVAVEQGGVLRMFARDPNDSAPLPDFAASSADPVHLTVLGYDARSGSLGFATRDGELLIATEPKLSRPLTPWSRAHARTISLDEDSGWGEIAPDTERALSAISVAALPACRSYSGRLYALTSTDSILTAYADGDDHAVIAQERRWFRLGHDDVTEIDAPVPGLRASAATRAPDGSIFIAGARGARFEVWARPPLGARFEQLPSTPSMQTTDAAEEIFFLSALSSNSLWTMTGGGHLAVYNDGLWQDLGVLPDVRGIHAHGGLQALETDRAEVLHPHGYQQNDARHVSFVHGNSIDTLPLTPGAGLVLPSTLSRDANGNATFYGGTDGRLYRLSNGALVLVGGEADTKHPLNDMTPVRSGIWSGVAAVGSIAGALEFYDSGELCPMNASSIDASIVVPIGQDLLILGQFSPSPEQMLDPEMRRTPAALLIVRGPPP